MYDESIVFHQKSIDSSQLKCLIIRVVGRIKHIISYDVIFPAIINNNVHCIVIKVVAFNSISWSGAISLNGIYMFPPRSLHQIPENISGANLNVSYTANQLNTIAASTRRQKHCC